MPSRAWSENKKHPAYDPTDMEIRYKSWLAQYGRQYKSRDEWLLRFGIYQSNVQFIDYINSQNLSFKLTDNKFADMTNDEFKSIYLGFRTGGHASKKLNQRYENYSELPTTVDWRKHGAVTPVKDQGQCGMRVFFQLFNF